jgi:hypothetical protein
LINVGCGCRNKGAGKGRENEGCACGKERAQVTDLDVFWDSEEVYNLGIKKGDDLHCIVNRISAVVGKLEDKIWNQ